MVAADLGASYACPFGGVQGRALEQAAAAKDVDAVLAIGEASLCAAIERANKSRLLILDRSWMTIATLVPWGIFSDRWTWWLPTILCLADPETTMARLATRDERFETEAWHLHYIDAYRRLALATDSPVVRTDLNGKKEAAELVSQHVRRLIAGSSGERHGE